MFSCSLRTMGKIYLTVPYELLAVIVVEILTILTCSCHRVVCRWSRRAAPHAAHSISGMPSHPWRVPIGACILRANSPRVSLTCLRLARVNLCTVSVSNQVERRNLRYLSIEMAVLVLYHPGRCQICDLLYIKIRNNQVLCPLHSVVGIVFITNICDL
jgi:hypothetical protein